jgi:TolB-like protein
MSPEQVRGDTLDQCSDLFSLGVILYELITGKRPFTGEYSQAVEYSILHDTPEPLARFKSGVPDDLQSVVSKLLEKDPALRYQNAEGVLPDLRQITSQDHKTLASRPKSGLPRMLIPSIVVALIIVLVLVLKPWKLEIASDDLAQASIRRLAVLYLANRGAADDEHLSYGITEDLIVDLTRIGTMGVAPMPSILKYKDSDEELDRIAEHLQVDLLLNGSIHKTGDLIRVSAQLIDVESGLNLWADRWEETFENLPRIKEALAQGISQALEIDTAVMQAAQVGTPDAGNPVAYDHYLRGKYTFEKKADDADVRLPWGCTARRWNWSLPCWRRGGAWRPCCISGDNMTRPPRNYRWHWQKQGSETCDRMRLLRCGNWPMCIATSRSMTSLESMPCRPWRYRENSETRAG